MRWFALNFLVCLSALATKVHSQTRDSITVEVFAHTLFQPTSLQVKKGETYQITAKGDWQDADFPATDANGFKGFTAPMFFGMLLKPLPSQYYMKLCGRVGNWKFPIGTCCTVTMKRSGELQLFANDAKGFFENNSGSLTVKIERLN